jgi:outer membrane protein TolC
MKRWKIGWLLAAPILISCVGCVSPGDINENEIYRLQQAILSRSPQDRPEEGLGLMRPSTPNVPPRPVQKDPKTAQRSIRMSLEDTIMRVLANNTDIAVVAFDPQIAREQVVQAAAAFDYVLFGSMGYETVDTAFNHRTGQPLSKDRTLGVGIRQQTVTGATWQISDTFARSWDSGNATQFGRWYQADLNMQVTQPLLRNAWPDVNLAALRIARLNHKVTLSQFRQQVETSVTQVINTYYQLIQAQRNVDIARRLLDKTIETYDKVKARESIDATKVNISQAEAAVKARQAVFIQAQKEAKDVQDALVRLLSDQQINLLQDFLIVPTMSLDDALVKIDETDQLLTALRLNPLLEQARLGISQADINIRVAKNQTLPALDLTASATFDGGSNRSRGQVWDDQWSGKFISYNAELALEYPLGNRAALAALSEARLQRKQLVTQMQNTADQLAQTIRERIRQIYTRFEEYKVQTEALRAAQEQLQALDDLEKIRGQLTPEFLNLKLQAQADVASAERAQLSALVQYHTARIDLDSATGATLERNRVQLIQAASSADGGEELDLPEAKPAPATKPATQPAKRPGKRFNVNPDGMTIMLDSD